MNLNNNYTLDKKIKTIPRYIYNYSIFNNKNRFAIV